MCKRLVENSWCTDDDPVVLLDVAPRCLRPQVHLIVSTIKDCRTFDKVVGQDPGLLLHKMNTMVVSKSSRESEQPYLLARKQTILGPLPSARSTRSCSSTCLISRQAMSVLPLPVSRLWSLSASLLATSGFYLHGYNVLCFGALEHFLLVISHLVNNANRLSLEIFHQVVCIF